jgi:hypothetical protein
VMAMFRRHLRSMYLLGTPDWLAIDSASAEIYSQMYQPLFNQYSISRVSPL